MALEDPPDHVPLITKLLVLPEAVLENWEPPSVLKDNRVLMID